MIISLKHNDSNKLHNMFCLFYNFTIKPIKWSLYNSCRQLNIIPKHFNCRFKWLGLPYLWRHSDFQLKQACYTVSNMIILKIPHNGILHECCCYCRRILVIRRILINMLPFFHNLVIKARSQILYWTEINSLCVLFRRCCCVARKNLMISESLHWNWSDNKLVVCWYQKSWRDCMSVWSQWKPDFK